MWMCGKYSPTQTHGWALADPSLPSCRFCCQKGGDGQSPAQSCRGCSPRTCFRLGSSKGRERSSGSLLMLFPQQRALTPRIFSGGVPACGGGGGRRRTLRARGKPTLPVQHPGPFWVVLGSGLTFCWLPEGCQPPSQPTQPNPPCREVGRLPDPGAFQMSPRISNTSTSIGEKLHACPCRSCPRPWVRPSS